VPEGKAVCIRENRQISDGESHIARLSIRKAASQKGRRLEGFLHIGEIIDGRTSPVDKSTLREHQIRCQRHFSYYRN
jgi:hypothetical protein